MPKIGLFWGRPCSIDSLPHPRQQNSRTGSSGMAGGMRLPMAMILCGCLYRGGSILIARAQSLEERFITELLVRALPTMRLPLPLRPPPLPCQASISHTELVQPLPGPILHSG